MTDAQPLPVKSIDIILNPTDATRPHVVVVILMDPKRAPIWLSYATRQEAEDRADKFRRGEHFISTPNSF